MSLAENRRLVHGVQVDSKTPFQLASRAEQAGSGCRAANPVMAAPALPNGPPGLMALREALRLAAERLAAYNPAYSLDDPIDVFLMQSAATGAAFRLHTISSLLDEGVCGLVAAAAARSLLEDAATWAWAAEDLDRVRIVADYLAAEWESLNKTAARSGVPNTSHDPLAGASHVGSGDCWWRSRSVPGN